MPRGDDPIKQAQRLAQDLSSNFKAVVKQINLNSSVTTNTALIGSVVTSMLTLAQIQALDPGFVLCDGGSCTGSTYAGVTGFTTVPDCRGRALRGKDNGSGHNPDGDTALGTYQADADAIAGGSVFSGSSYPLYGASSVDRSSGNETRMKNITVNIFIKIN